MLTYNGNSQKVKLLLPKCLLNFWRKTKTCTIFSLTRKYQDLLGGFNFLILIVFQFSPKASNFSPLVGSTCLSFINDCFNSVKKLSKLCYLNFFNKWRKTVHYEVINYSYIIELCLFSNFFKDFHWVFSC